LVTAVAFAVVGVLVWHFVRPRLAVPPSRTTVTDSAGNAEDLSDAERRSLKEILKRKSAGAQK
jgi:hypothetical protein